MPKPAGMCNFRPTVAFLSYFMHCSFININTYCLSITKCTFSQFSTPWPIKMDYIKYSYVAFEFGTEDAVKVHVIVEKLLTIFNLAEQQLFTHTQTQANTHTHPHTQA